MSKLVNCKACNKEVSKNAVSCPHCGEVNKVVVRRKQLWWKIPLIFLLLTVILNVTAETPMPDCKSGIPDAIKAFDNGFMARNWNIQIIAVENEKEISFDPKIKARDRTTSATINSGDVMVLRYKISAKDSGFETKVKLSEK